MNKKGLIDVLSNYTLTKKDAKKFVDLIFNTIKDNLIAGEKVTIQNFGSFIPKFYKSKKMFNPKTEKYLTLKPRRKIKFFLSRSFLKILNKDVRD